MLYFTVGPSQLYTGVREFYSKSLENGVGSISHRSADFTEISQSGIAQARQFFSIPEDYKIYYTYSATESMELVVRSLVEKKSVHVVNGNFGKVWYSTAVHNGREVKKYEVLNTINPAAHIRVNLDDIEDSELVSADVVCMTGSETASGIGYSPKEISDFSQKIHTVSENTLLAVDVTSGMGAIDYDISSADVWLFSVQKALGLPAGLGFLVLSPKAYARAQKIAEERNKQNSDCGNHHAIAKLEGKMAGKFQTPTTPNTLAIAGFGYICKQFTADFTSIKNLSKRTEEKAEYMYSFFESEQNTSGFVPAIDEQSARTQTVIVIKIKNAEKMSEKEVQNIMQAQVKKCEDAGFPIASGYGKLQHTQLRLANFPVHTMNDIRNLLESFTNV